MIEPNGKIYHAATSRPTVHRTTPHLQSAAAGVTIIVLISGLRLHDS